MKEYALLTDRKYPIYFREMPVSSDGTYSFILSATRDGEQAHVVVAIGPYVFHYADKAELTFTVENSVRELERVLDTLYLRQYFDSLKPLLESIQ